MRGWVAVLGLGAGLACPGAALAEGEGRLTIRFEGLEEARGDVLVSLADSRAVFESDTEAFRQAAIPAEVPAVSVTFEGIAAGEYAAKVFHDANGNRELDIGWRGPTEMFGFSNDVMGLMGLPDFDDAKFGFDGGVQTHVIQAR